MIYFTTHKGKAAIILEAGNIEHLKTGGNVVTPDENIMVLYTPDILWFQEEALKRGLFSGQMDAAGLQALIDEGKDRAPVVERPYHPLIKMNASKGEA